MERVRIVDSRGLKATVPVSHLPELVPVDGLDVLVENMRSERERLVACPVCGWTADRYSESGLMGCGFCYSLFLESLEQSGPVDAGSE